MQARELMTPRPQVVTGEEPVSRVAQLMCDLDVGIIPVVDDRAYMHPRGVITDRDIVMRWAAASNCWTHRVKELMTAPVVTVAPGAHVQDVLRTMERHQLRRILVVDHGRLVGIIALADLVLKYGPLAPLQVERVIEAVSAPAPAGV